MWFGVLGPLLVRDGDSVVSVPAGRQRVLLAALLMRAGAVVSADALADYLWDGSPPSGAETTLRSHVMRLRRVLGPAVVRRHAFGEDPAVAGVDDRGQRRVLHGLNDWSPVNGHPVWILVVAGQRDLVPRLRESRIAERPAPGR